METRVGDLVKVTCCSSQCQQKLRFGCRCTLCESKSSRIGVVIEPRATYTWAVMFDFGEYLISDVDFICGDVEVINENR